MRSEFVAKISRPEKSALLRYSSYEYGAINGRLREGHAPDRLARHMDKALEKSRTTETIVTQRASDAIPAVAAMKPGQVFIDKGFMSTTVHDASHLGFGGGKFIYHITSPPGTKIAPIPSHHTSEGEMLLGRGTALRLDRREQSGYQTIFHMTVVGQK